MAVIELSEIKNPLIQVKLPNGETRDYDVWDITEKLEKEYRKAGSKDEDATFADNFDAVRLAFGFPTAAEAKTKGEFTLAQQHCQALRAAVNDVLEKDQFVKKLVPSQK